MDTVYTYNTAGLSGAEPTSTDPGIANVVSGVVYTINDVGYSGTFDEAARNTITSGDVKSGTSYQHLGITTTGSYVIPIVITGITPTGADSEGYIEVELTSDSAFVGVTAVTIDGVPARSFTVNSASSITAVFPKTSAGFLTISAT